MLNASTGPWFRGKISSAIFLFRTIHCSLTHGRLSFRPVKLNTELGNEVAHSSKPMANMLRWTWNFSSSTTRTTSLSSHGLEKSGESSVEAGRVSFELELNMSHWRLIPHCEVSGFLGNVVCRSWFGLSSVKKQKFNQVSVPCVTKKICSHY